MTKPAPAMSLLYAPYSMGAVMVITGRIFSFILSKISKKRAALKAAQSQG